MTFIMWLDAIQSWLEAAGSYVVFLGQSVMLWVTHHGMFTTTHLTLGIYHLQTCFVRSTMSTRNFQRTLCTWEKLLICFSLTKPCSHHPTLSTWPQHCVIQKLEDTTEATAWPGSALVNFSLFHDSFLYLALALILTCVFRNYASSLTFLYLTYLYFLQQWGFPYLLE